MATVLECVHCAIGWWGGTGVGIGVLLGWLLITLGGTTTVSLTIGWLFATLGSGILVVAGDGLCVSAFPGCGANIACRLSITSICLFMLSGDHSARTASTNARGQWIMQSSVVISGISSM